MNVSVLNRVQIPQQFLESWLRPIGVKGKFGGGYGAEHGDGARTGKVPQCHACSGLTVTAPASFVSPQIYTLPPGVLLEARARKTRVCWPPPTVTVRGNFWLVFTDSQYSPN